MKYTTADFAMAGGIKTGVLSRITGQLGNTVAKAKNWLGKTRETKQALGSATTAKNRLKPQAYVSPNAGAEAMARRKYGESLGLAEAQASQSLNASTRNNNYQYAKNAQSKGILANAGTGKLTDGLANQQSLRLRYTKDPRTGKLVGSAYSKQLSLLCDL